MGEPRSWGEFTAELVKLIGQAADTGGSPTAGTVFGKENAILGKINSFVNADGNGVRVVKSIQRLFVSGNGNQNVAISPVNPERCFVISERLYNNATYQLFYNYTLEADRLEVNISAGSGQNCYVGFWIVEFY